ncbi:MAG: nuclear transport factor 2 family protein [Myxococcaceae bacterium]
MLVAIAILLTAGSTRASERTEVMAVVNQFIDGFNKDDVKTALAACAAAAFIIDEFPPYAWQGPTACSDWANDFDANSKKEGITQPVVTLGKARHLEVTGERAYVVVPASYNFKQNGNPTAETGSIWTVALQKVAAGWRITGWAWSKH